MWVKAPSGELVNLANIETVYLRVSGSDPYYVRADNWLIYRGPKELCQQIMDDIEHGIINRAILVDLMNRESHGNQT